MTDKVRKFRAWQKRNKVKKYYGEIYRKINLNNPIGGHRLG